HFVRATESLQAEQKRRDGEHALHQGDRPGNSRSNGRRRAGQGWQTFRCTLAAQKANGKWHVESGIRPHLRSCQGKRCTRRENFGRRWRRVLHLLRARKAQRISQSAAFVSARIAVPLRSRRIQSPSGSMKTKHKPKPVHKMKVKLFADG